RVGILRRIDQLDRLINREAQRVLGLLGLRCAGQREQSGGKPGGEDPRLHETILPVFLALSHESNSSAHALIARRDVLLETERVIRPHIDVGENAAAARRRLSVDRRREGDILRTTGDAEREQQNEFTHYKVLSMAPFHSSFPRKRESRR